MTLHPVVPAWARDFNNQRRHCWPDRDGARMLDQNAAEYKRGDWEPQPCTTEHDPKLTGNVEWLRFIREFGRVAKSFGPEDTGVPNPFGADDKRHFLLNEVDGHTTSDGRRTYCETYLRSDAQDDADLWGLKVVFRVFLDNEAGWARIECYDEELVGECEQALAKVEESYQKEVTA